MKAPTEAGASDRGRAGERADAPSEAPSSGGTPGALTHIDAAGEARMVDVGGKAVTERVGAAAGTVLVAPETLALIVAGDAKKGDVLGTARVAGIMAAKRTHDLIPLCHPLALTSVAVDLAAERDPPRVEVRARVTTTGRTGVEMEALTAVSVACLTVYDMVKAVDRSIRITDIRVVEKRGGQSGDYYRAEPA